MLIYTNPASLGLSPFLLEERYREDSLLSELFILSDSRPDSLTFWGASRSDKENGI